MWVVAIFKLDRIFDCICRFLLVCGLISIYLCFNFSVWNFVCLKNPSRVWLKAVRLARASGVFAAVGVGVYSGS